MDLEQATKGYFDTRKRLESNWSNPLKLSDIIFKMSTYISHVADHLGDLKSEYETARAKSYMHYLQEGKSASNSENLARVDTAEVRGQIAKLELMKKSGDNLASIGQSRLRVLENENRGQI